MIVLDHRHRSGLSASAASGLVAYVTLAIVLTGGNPVSLLVHGATGHVSEFDIVEELSPRTFVGTVRTNPDIAELLNGTVANSLRFSFRYPKGATAALFSIDDRTGDIRTNRRIDREQLCSLPTCHLLLDVTVLPVRIFRILRVRINVVDLNDNTPTFANTRLNVEVRENASPGVMLALPTAEDADSGDFGVRRYEMTSLPDPSADNPFRLTVRRQSSSQAQSASEDDDDAPDVNAMEVLLTVTDRLDREVQSSYLLRLTAYDGGLPTPRSGTVDVTVVVVDANDNGPRFEATLYEADVNENQPRGTTIVRVHATDPDEGLNGEVVYRLADQTPTTASGGSSSSGGGSDTTINSPFAIDNRTGEIYVVDTLDAEKYVGYQLTVVAADRGVGSLPAYARVTVRVADANDNRPTIVVNSLTESGHVEVVESSASGAFVAFVTARDSDSGKNGAVDCLLTAGSTRFRLEPVSGTDSGGEYKLITTTRFDREVADQHIVTLHCADNGRPPLTATAEIEIFVIDENDNAPTFDGGPMPTAVIAEGNYIGATIITMNATDLDTGPNARLAYQLQPLDDTPDGAADIDTQTGVVYAMVAFDYETRREYRYRVTVSDNGENVLSGTSLLVVRVLDVNDERPLFDTSIYHFTISENRPVGTSVGKIRATDSDISASFSRIVYAITQGQDSFELNPVTGVLSTARRLDREETAVYELTVRATNDVFSSNSGLPLPPNPHGSPPAASPQSTVTVVVRIEDENDNPPSVRFPTAADRLVIEVSASAPIGTLLTRIEASDPDDGPNGAIVYAVANGNEEGLFAIDHDTGTLTTARRLGQTNRDGSPSSAAMDSSRSHRLVVTVRDRGSPERLAVADLTILVNCSTISGKMPPSRQSYDSSNLADDDAEHGVSGTLSSSSSIFGALFADTSQRVVVIAMVVTGSLLIIIVIVTVVAISLAVCRWRRRQRRKLSDRRRDEWLRQQASAACSDAGCSCSERRSAASNRSFCGNRTLQRRDSGSLAGSSVATSSMRGAGGRLTVLMPQMTSTSLCRGGTWSTAVIDTASCTDRDNDGDESENDDVMLSTGLMKSASSTSPHHTCRCDADRSQSVGLLTGIAANSPADCSLKPPTPASIQRTTPDVLRQASGATDSSCMGGYSAVPTSASTPGTTRSNGNAQRSSGSKAAPSGGPPRYHYHHPHHQRSRRTSRSPSGSLRVGYRPSSASSGTVATAGGGHGSRRHRRREQRHTSKSDMEMSDLNADIDSESEFSEATTCRDSGMDHSEDSDNVAPTGILLPLTSSSTSAMTSASCGAVNVFPPTPLIIS